MKNIEDMNYYEILGVSTDASQREIHDAYLISVSTYGAESISSYSIISEEEKLGMLKRIETAYLTIHDPDKKKMYNEEILKISPESCNMDHKTNIEIKTQQQSNVETETQHEIKESRPFFRLRWPFKKRKDPGADSGERQEEDQAKERDKIEQGFDGNIKLGGTYLKNIREVKGLTIKEVSEKTRIRMTYLQAIEEDDLAKLPGKVFIQGFVKSYSEFLGLDSEQIVKNHSLQKQI